ncbi:MAG: 1,4-dihydroxy-2-naphthoate polyprenyltransferase [Anaerolineae bacterium]|nr:1,4-dihydroxy-2-naphthoate polyprenyltransferase [Anaerolineae bacterium]
MTAPVQPKTLSKWDAWRMAARPKTLPAAVGPVLVGVGVAISLGQFAPLPALAALAGALLLQIAVNLANDYFDFVKGVDTAERLGPPRAAASGALSTGELRTGIAVVLGLSMLVGLYLISVGGLPILIIGVASILSALAYSGGPFPLASNGLGDVFVFIFFGMIAVVGTYYVQSLTLHPLAFIAAVPVGALITAIIVVNNYRDMETDRKSGKRTLAVILGKRGTQLEYMVLIAIAYLTPVVLMLMGYLSGFLILLPLFTIPMGLGLIQDMRSLTGPALNKVLAETARLSLIYSALFAFGLTLYILRSG